MQLTESGERTRRHRLWDIDEYWIIHTICTPLYLRCHVRRDERKSYIITGQLSRNSSYRLLQHWPVHQLIDFQVSARRWVCNAGKASEWPVSQPGMRTAPKWPAYVRTPACGEETGEMGKKGDGTEATFGKVRQTNSGGNADAVVRTATCTNLSRSYARM